jgi:hypothetical protein
MARRALKKRYGRSVADGLAAKIRSSGGRIRFEDRAKRNSPEARARGPRWTAFVSVFGYDVSGEGATQPEALAHAIASLPANIARHFA